MACGKYLLLSVEHVIQCILCFHFDLVEQGNLLVGRPVRWPGVASAAGGGGGRNTEGQSRGVCAPRAPQPLGGHSLNPKYVAFDRIFHSFFLPLNQVSLYFLMNHSLRSFKKLCGTSRVFSLTEKLFPTVLCSTVGDIFSLKLLQTGKKLIIIKKIFLPLLRVN